MNNYTDLLEFYKRATKDSPALQFQSEHYPQEWQGRVPLIVTVVQEIEEPLYQINFLTPTGHSKPEPGTAWPAYVNRHGAVLAILEPGVMFGLKPSEFEVIEWHERAAKEKQCPT